MKNIDLKKLGVNELTSGEMVTIEGGSWLSRAWNNVCYVAGCIADAIYDAVVFISNNFE